MIRFITETISSERDSDGNKYHFARVTSTRTGKRLVIRETWGESNASHLVRELLGLRYKEVFSAQYTLPKRRWQARQPKKGLWEWDVKAAHLQALEE